MEDSKRATKARFVKRRTIIDRVPIRKLFVAPIKPSIRNKLRGYFSVYGKVESVRHAVASKLAGHSAFIIFKSPKSARAALSNPMHRINNRTVMVRAASKWHQPDFKQTKKPLLPERSCPHILNILSDECLKKVFKRLNLRDLCNVADVCKRFKHNANEAFKSAHTSVNIFDLAKGDDQFHEEWFKVRFLYKKFLKYAVQLFRNFGPFIKALTLTGTEIEAELKEEHDLMRMAEKYCTSLTGLTLVGICGDELDDEFFSRHLPTETLAIEKFNAKEHLLDYPELKSLKVERCTGSIWLHHTFPKLQSLEIEDIRQFHYKLIDEFLQRHGDLRTFKYEAPDWDSSDFITIEKYFPKLETLYHSFQDFTIYPDMDQRNVKENADILQLSKLKSLKTLSLEFRMENGTNAMKLLIDAFLKEKTPIERFEIVRCKMGNELITSLPKLTTLKALRLVECKLESKSLIHLAQELTKHAKLIMKDCYGFMKSDPKKIKKLPFAEKIHFLTSSKKTLPMPIDQSSALILDILDDDCLIEIFKFMSLRDLCNVADVCQRFQVNAKEVCETRLEGDFDLKKIKAANGTGQADMQLAEKFFRNFGSLVYGLKLNGYKLETSDDKETILYLVDKYCRQLMSLELESFHIKGPLGWLKPIEYLFEDISLELRDCDMDESFGQLLSISELSDLRIYYTFTDSDAELKWMKNTFPSLRTFVLDSVDMPESAFEAFMELNGNLTKLIINHTNLSSNIFETVGNHLTNLRTFKFGHRNRRSRNGDEHVLHLAKLKSLKELMINSNMFSVKLLIDELVKENIQIEDLEILNGNVDMELLTKLSRLVSMKSLRLDYTKMDTVSLIDLAKQLPKLERLDLDIAGINTSDIVKMLPFVEHLRVLKIGSRNYEVQIEVDDYRSLLQIVKDRANASMLSIIIDSYRPKVMVPYYMRQQNRHRLRLVNEIKEQTIEYNRNAPVSETESESDMELGLSDMYPYDTDVDSELESESNYSGSDSDVSGFDNEP